MEKITQRSSPWTAYLLLTIAPLFWAGNMVLARGVAETLPPVALAFWRWTTACIILLPFSWHHARRNLSTVVHHWKMICLIALLGISVFNTLVYQSMHTTTAINGALIQSVMPAIIILITWGMFREHITGIQIVGVVSCMVGAAWVVLHGRWEMMLRLNFVQGDLLMLLAVSIYALYSVLLRKRPDIHPLSFLVFTFGIGSTALLPFYMLEIVYVGGFALNRPNLASIFYVAVFPSIISFFCWNRGVELIGANRAGLFVNLIPLFASVMAVMWLGESVQHYHFAGMALILGGMVLFNR